MLQTLAIRNIAIIDEIAIDFEQGLNVMTGETGAGKTMIAQSLALVLGARAQPDMIRTGETEAEVTATFQIDAAGSPQGTTAARLLEDSGIACDDGAIVIRRVISAQGRSKITINGVAATAGMLKNLASHLVDVSSQHEHQLLLDPANHVDVIDDFGVPRDVRDAYRGAYEAHAALRDEIVRLRADETAAKERLDFLKFQLDELRAASPQPGELSELEEKRQRVKHAATLDASARDAVNVLYEAPGSVAEVLSRLANDLVASARLDAAFTPWSETIERITTEIEEVARDARAHAESLSSEPGQLEEIEDRVHLLKGLVRKHGGSLEDVIAKMDAIAREIAQTENFDEVLEAKERELAQRKIELKDAGKRLSAARDRAGKKLTEAVQEELRGLAMGKVRFTPRVEQLPLEAWEACGPERVEFFIAPNIGEEPKPLVRIASGGELSRVMLAIKRVVAEKANLAATYVFDEVDSGIGGATAEVVGRKLMEVAQARQVICITHLPQVACFGGAHFRIGKRVAKGRTITEVGRLTDDARVDEIARMLGGASLTTITKTHAKELLGSVSCDTRTGKGL